MQQKDLSEKLALAVDFLKKAGATEIYLFGSYAKGNANDNSDIGVKGISSASIYGLWFDLEDLLNMKVDLVDFDISRDFYNHLSKTNSVVKIGDAA